MKILILNGSPHREGSSSLLIREFTRGAQEAGHTVKEFRCSGAEIHPCTACYHCAKGMQPCVFQDDMNQVNALLEEADLAVFASPLYYYGLSTQLKTVIDRFFGKNGHWREAGKKMAVLMTCGDSDPSAFDAVKMHLRKISEYLHWKFVGGVFADSSYHPEDTAKTDFPQQAYELGRSL